MMLILGIKTILLFFYLGPARADYPINDEDAFYRNGATNLNQNTNINQNTNTGWPGWNRKTYMQNTDRKIWRHDDGGVKFLSRNGRFRDDDDEYETSGDPKLRSGSIREFVRRNFSQTLKRVLEELLALIEEDMEKPAEDVNIGDEDIDSELVKIDLPQSAETSFQDVPLNTDTPSLFYDEWPYKAVETRKGGTNSAAKGFLSMKNFSLLRRPRFLDAILKPKIRKARMFFRKLADKFFGPLE